MSETSIPAEDNVEVTAPAPDVADNKPVVEDDNNLDASKSDNTEVVADDGKKSEEQPKVEDTPASPKLDSDLDDWIEKRGLKKPETDEERASFQQLRNDQREFTKSRQAEKTAEAAKELGDEIHNFATEKEDDDGLDPLEKKVNEIEKDRAFEKTTRLQSEFYQSNNLTADSPEHKAILDIFKEETSKGETDAEKSADLEYWSNPKRLPTLLQLAKARLAENPDTEAIAEEAAQKEREKIEKESHANSPGRAATQHSPSDKTEAEAQAERFKARFNS